MGSVGRLGYKGQVPSLFTQPDPTKERRAVAWDRRKWTLVYLLTDAAIALVNLAGHHLQKTWGASVKQTAPPQNPWEHRG
jgi:hypothetical protein